MSAAKSAATVIDQGKKIIVQLAQNLATEESRKALRNRALRRIDRLRLSAGLLYLINNPYDLDRLFKVIDGGAGNAKERYPEVIAFINEQGYSHEGFRQLWEQRYLPPMPDLEVLKDFEPGTFGRVFADHMIERGHAVDFYPEVPVEDEFDYINMRFRQTHDLFHVLTGFDTDLSGEAGVLAFTYGQICSPLSLLLATGALNIIALENLEQLEGTFDRIISAYQAGKKSGFLLDHPLESYWAKPLTEVRLLVGLPEGGVV